MTPAPTELHPFDRTRRLIAARALVREAVHLAGIEAVAEFVLLMAKQRRPRH